MPEIIRARQAEMLGLKKYFTGEACKNGHIDQRWVGDRQCCECARIKCRKIHAQRRLLDPDWSKRVNMKNYAKHREVRKEKMRSDSRARFAALAALQEIGIVAKKRVPKLENATANEKKKMSRERRILENPEILRKEAERARNYYWENADACRERHRARSKLATAAFNAISEVQSSNRRDI